MTDQAKPPLFIRLNVETIEDLHTGSGAGSGDIDAVVQRDRHGWPVIRASHFKGLLREAGDELIALGKMREEDLNILLGTGGKNRGALRMTSLKWCRGGATVVWGSTKRVDGSRAPEEDTLRYVEHVPAGTQFQAQLRLPDDTLVPLLERLVRRIDRIGGDRNRGSGLVQTRWSAYQPNINGLRLRLVLRNLEPICLPMTGYPGNLIRSYSFIRGQTLRGALIAWAIRSGQQEALGLFDQVSIGDALPLPEGIAQAHTVLPIPLSIQTQKPKGGDARLPWWAGDSSAASVFDSLDNEKQSETKRPGAHEYLCCSDKKIKWLRYRPAMRVRLRNATPEKGSKEEAELFSVEEIAEDTCFQAELYFPNEACCQRFIGAFAQLICGGDWLAIGRGGQPVIINSVAVPPETSQKVFNDSWTLTLVSDLIVRGEHLGFLDNLGIGQLCEWAGIDEQPGWDIKKAVVETAAIHGFNAASGLRRAPALGMRRGSCWLITGVGSAALVKKLAEKTALGERTREGLGRFLIDAQPIREICQPEHRKAEPPANRNEELLLRAQKLADQLAKSGSSPSLSQLQWLRGRALAATDVRQLDALLTEIETAPEHRRQGGRAWKAFPTAELKGTLDQIQNSDKQRELNEKRQLISCLVQWRAPQAKIERENRG
jgi:hypothetical protein